MSKKATILTLAVSWTICELLAWALGFGFDPMGSISATIGAIAALAIYEPKP